MSIKRLAGEGNFAYENILQVRGREAQELCKGVWIYEIAEPAGLHKSEVEHVKAFISRTHDKARPAYGTAVEIRPRTCIFIGTTNKDSYLIDPTGNRRFWPVPVTKAELKKLAEDRDQLWAEAVVVEATGEELILTDDLKAEAIVRAKVWREVHGWEDIT